MPAAYPLLASSAAQASEARPAPMQATHLPFVARIIRAGPCRLLVWIFRLSLYGMESLLDGVPAKDMNPP